MSTHNTKNLNLFSIFIFIPYKNRKIGLFSSCDEHFSPSSRVILVLVIRHLCIVFDQLRVNTSQSIVLARATHSNQKPKSNELNINKSDVLNQKKMAKNWESELEQNSDNNNNDNQVKIVLVRILLLKLKFAFRNRCYVLWRLKSVEKSKNNSQNKHQTVFIWTINLCIRLHSILKFTKKNNNDDASIADTMHISPNSRSTTCFVWVCPKKIRVIKLTFSLFPACTCTIYTHITFKEGKEIEWARAKKKRFLFIFCVSC